MKAYSQDLRLRILRAVDSGMTKAAVARRFAVALSTVKNYLAQRDAGPGRPRGVPGPAPRIGPDAFAAIVAQVRAAPDATLAEHAAAWERAHGARVSRWTMGRVIRRLATRREKNSDGRSDISGRVCQNKHRQTGVRGGGRRRVEGPCGRRTP